MCLQYTVKVTYTFPFLISAKVCYLKLLSRLGRPASWLYTEFVICSALGQLALSQYSGQYCCHNIYNVILLNIRQAIFVGSIMHTL